MSRRGTPGAVYRGAFQAPQVDARKYLRGLRERGNAPELATVIDAISATRSLSSAFSPVVESS